jgi:hypothetical protein
MKKLALIIIMIAFCSVAMAGPRAVGGRLGWGIGPSYQHGFGEKNMLQVDLDLLGYGWWGIQASVTYDWIFPIKSWTKEGSWNWYAGVGGGGGYEWFGGVFGRGYYGSGRARGGYGGAFVGAVGMIGVEYNFKFPLQLSFDYRPLIGVGFGGHRAYFYTHGLYCGAIALGIRYKF